MLSIFPSHLGETVEKGSHDELMEERGAYWKLVQAQEQEEVEEMENSADLFADQPAPAPVQSADPADAVQPSADPAAPSVNTAAPLEDAAAPLADAAAPLADVAAPLADAAAPLVDAAALSVDAAALSVGAAAPAVDAAAPAADAAAPSVGAARPLQDQLEPLVDQGRLPTKQSETRYDNACICVQQLCYTSLCEYIPYRQCLCSPVESFLDLSALNR